jgi:hypothetical protein
MSLGSYEKSEGDRLRQAYEEADEHYKWAVSEMSRHRETATDEDFGKLTQNFQEAGAATAAALDALNLFKLKSTLH